MQVLTIVAMLVGVSASSYASALWDIYIEPYSTAGDQLQFNFTDYDSGTLYSPSFYPDTNPDVNVGTQYSVTGDSRYAPGLSGTNGFDWDSWGILKLTGVRNVTTSTDLWLAGGGNLQVYGLYFGETDDQVTVNNQLNPSLKDIHISGNDAQWAAWEIAGGASSTATYFDNLAKLHGTGGLLTAGGSTMPGYTGITDQGGQLVMAGSSIPFNWGTTPIPGTYDFGSAYTLNTGSGGFSGSSWFLAQDPDIARNGYANPSINPELSTLWNVTGYPSKFYMHQDYTTTDAGPTGAKWTASSSDPAFSVVSPELSSSALMLLGMLPIGLGWWRRRKA